MKNKKIISLLCCLATLVSTFSACAETPSVSESQSASEEASSAVTSGESTGAATVYTNGAIYTVEGENWSETPVEALAVDAEGIISFLGTTKDAEAFIGEGTEVIDLEGKMMLPGFIDGHIHAPGVALTELYDIYLYESITKEKTLEDIKAFVDANPDLDEYWGRGFTIGIGEDPRGPQKEWLDEIVSDKPIILTSNDGHNVWMNSKAFEMNGITTETANPAGGTVQKTDDGELWGILTDASSLIAMKQTYSEEQQLSALSHFQDSMSAWGFTSAMFIYPHRVSTDLYKTFEDNGDLNMRLSLAGGIEPELDFETQLSAAIDLRDSMADSELIDVPTVKYFTDGVVEGMTAYMLEPYAPESGMPEDYVAEFYWNPEELSTYFDRSMEEGFQLHVHSIGDASTRLVLDSMEYAQAENPDADNRNVIAHLQVVDEADIPRLGELEIIGATQPYWHFREPEWFDVVDELVLGAERAATTYPVKSLIDTGAILTFSGDHPVSPVNNPLWAIEVAVTRNLNNPEYYGVEDITDIDDPTWLLNPAERITVAQAIEAYTVNSAYQLYREDEVGTLAVGKKADLVVFGENLFEISPIEIDSVEITATIFNGEIVNGAL